MAKQLDPYTLRWVAARIKSDYCACADCSDINNNLFIFGRQMKAKGDRLARALTKTPKAARKRNG